MVSAKRDATLPLFYKDIVPLNSHHHKAWHSRTTDKASWLVAQNVVPLTVGEFAEAQRHYPIIFSIGDEPIPLALMGMGEGMNLFVEQDGSLAGPVYIPAYARRYPFTLARLASDDSDLSLCFDPTSELVGNFNDGAPLFDGDDPSEACRSTLQFCEQFEIASQKTGAFMAELHRLALLVEGEFIVHRQGEGRPLVYSGFQMIDESKFQNLGVKALGQLHRQGWLSPIDAHLFSLRLMSRLLHL